MILIEGDINPYICHYDFLTHSSPPSFENMVQFKWLVVEIIVEEKRYSVGA